MKDERLKMKDERLKIKEFCSVDLYLVYEINIETKVLGTISAKIKK